MSRRYSLHGFAGGSARGPHFIEPVYSDGTTFFVQVSSGENDTVSHFRAFDDDVDMFEHDGSETLAVGEQCTYGVIDSGQRLIYGDRNYVSRYLSQNIRNYIDNPYFLKECIAFTGARLPEFECVNSAGDLLELSVAASSIKEFTRSKAGVRNWICHAMENRVAIGDEGVRLVDLLDGNSTVFGAWLAFANERNHRVAKSHKWRNIEKSYLSIYADDAVLANKSFRIHYLNCFNALRDEELKTSGSRDYREAVALSKLLPRVKGADLEEGSYRLRVGTSHTTSGISESLGNVVSTALRTNKIDRISIVLQLYFMSVVIKVTFDIMEKKD